MVLDNNEKGEGTTPPPALTQEDIDRLREQWQKDLKQAEADYFRNQGALAALDIIEKTIKEREQRTDKPAG